MGRYKYVLVVHIELISSAQSFYSLLLWAHHPAHLHQLWGHSPVHKNPNHNPHRTTSGRRRQRLPVPAGCRQRDVQIQASASGWTWLQGVPPSVLVLRLPAIMQPTCGAHPTLQRSVRDGTQPVQLEHAPLWLVLGQTVEVWTVPDPWRESQLYIRWLVLTQINLDNNYIDLILWYCLSCSVLWKNL